MSQFKIVKDWPIANFVVPFLRFRFSILYYDDQYETSYYEILTCFKHCFN